MIRRRGVFLGVPTAGPRLRSATQCAPLALQAVWLLWACSGSAPPPLPARAVPPSQPPVPRAAPPATAPWRFAMHLPASGPGSEAAVRRATATTGPRILLPSRGAPALARGGGGLTVSLLWPAGRPRPDPRTIRARLRTRVLGQSLDFPLWLERTRKGSRVQGSGPSGAIRLRFRVPPGAPRETYDLALRVAAHPPLIARRAVRVLHRLTGPFRFAVLADHQLWDPSGHLLQGNRNARAYPRRGERTQIRAMARQVLHELHLLDPDGVLQLGDLVFGLNVEAELRDAVSLWDPGGPATFFVPGNHDGYARYGIDLRGSLAALAGGLLRCRHLIPTRRAELRWPRLWRLLTCVYGDLRPVLFRRLLADGLLAWRRQMGPDAYAFELGRVRFVGLNSYDGSPARRHAYSIWVDIKGLHLGAPFVDNYGGTLSPPQLRFLRSQAAAARRAGQRLVVFAHHDPRGNLAGVRYHQNDPFPTDPVGADHFEAWNYDGAWDSDPADGRGRESPANNSATALLRLLAAHGGLYLSGHVHFDRERRYAPGEPLVPGVRARAPVHFVTVTTASAAPQKQGYWGYRIVTIRPDGTVRAPPYLPGGSEPLLSVPAGNLWFTCPPSRRIDGGQGSQGVPEHRIGTLHTGLPRPTTVRIRALLPLRAEGYAFRIRPVSPALPANASPAAASTPPAIALRAVTPLSPTSRGAPSRRPLQALYDLEVRVPAAPAAALRAASAVRRFAITARPLPVGSNRPPRIRVVVAGHRADPGVTTLVPTAEKTRIQVTLRDPEGHPTLPPTLWTPQARGGRGATVWVSLSPGDTLLTVRAADSHGAVATRRYRLRVGVAQAGAGLREKAPAIDADSRACLRSDALWLGLAGLSVLLGLALMALPSRWKNP